MTVWFTSDTHFFHGNVIKYENRPFANVDEMNAEIIKRWNNTVSNNDIVFHLGDVSFKGVGLTTDTVQKLNGRKHLIMGNHDRARSMNWWRQVGFEWVSAYPIVYAGFLMLSHEPMYVNGVYVNVHGHIHGQLCEDAGHVNVCVEHHNYTPVSLEKLIELAGGTPKEIEAPRPYTTKGDA